MAVVEAHALLLTVPSLFLIKQSFFSAPSSSTNYSHQSLNHPALFFLCIMRESNFYFPAHNKASVSITSALYDRRGPSFCCSIKLITNQLTASLCLSSHRCNLTIAVTINTHPSFLSHFNLPSHQGDTLLGWWSRTTNLNPQIHREANERATSEPTTAASIPFQLHTTSSIRIRPSYLYPTATPSSRTSTILIIQSEPLLSPFYTSHPGLSIPSLPQPTNLSVY